MTPSDVEFRVACHPEELPSAEAGEAATDRETAGGIRAQLNCGNAWAWCCVHVVACWQHDEADETLGCCSYRNEADFCTPGGDCDDLKDAALARLNAELARHAEVLDALRC